MTNTLTPVLQIRDKQSQTIRNFIQILNIHRTISFFFFLKAYRTTFFLWFQKSTTVNILHITSLHSIQMVGTESRDRTVLIYNRKYRLI